MYSQMTKPPSHGVGDPVKAQGRYGAQSVVGVLPNAVPPTGGSDGHLYAVQGGRGGRISVHGSGELTPFTIGTEELQ